MNHACSHPHPWGALSSPRSCHLEQVQNPGSGSLAQLGAAALTTLRFPGTPPTPQRVQDLRWPLVAAELTDPRALPLPPRWEWCSCFLSPQATPALCGHLHAVSPRVLWGGASSGSRTEAVMGAQRPHYTLRSKTPRSRALPPLREGHRLKSAHGYRLWTLMTCCVCAAAGRPHSAVGTLRLRRFGFCVRAPDLGPWLGVC